MDILLKNKNDVFHFNGSISSLPIGRFNNCLFFIFPLDTITPFYGFIGLLQEMPEEIRLSSLFLVQCSYYLRGVQENLVFLSL